MNFWFSLALLCQFSQAFDVEGHRGARALRPENTLPAFTYAVEAGADTLELDLAVTSDGVLVISHDPFINGEHCQGPDAEPVPKDLWIHSLPIAKIKTFDCGSRKNPLFAKQQTVAHTSMPTFKELLQWLKDSKLPQAKTVRLNVETKIYPAHPERELDPKSFVELILSALREFNMIERTTLESFDDRSLKVAKELEPKLKTALLTSENHIDYVAAVKAAHADILSPDQEWLLSDDVVALHKAGIQVLPWTANDEKSWSRLVKMQVDGIISDDPAALIAFLKRQGLRSTR